MPSGRHPADTHDRIRVRGAREHNLKDISVEIIDLGPGAGHDGGEIVFEGRPADLVARKSTLTGQRLASFVGR